MAKDKQEPQNEPEAAKSKPGGSARSARRGARLAAVQALYQLEMNQAAPTQVIAEFESVRLDDKADRELFADIVSGTTARVEELDGEIGRLLAEGWTVERLESVLRAILRAGAYELVVRLDVPPRVAINEYVEIAYSFFGGREPGLVNGVLDRLAKERREDELRPS
jgi:N utilization substance protein B